MNEQRGGRDDALPALCCASLSLLDRSWLSRPL